MPTDSVVDRPGRPRVPVDGMSSDRTGIDDDTPDDVLARAAADGDEQAFELILGRHGPTMLRFARRMLGDEHDAAEAVQEAFISAWQNLDRFEGRSSLRTWLFRLVHRRGVDLMRRRRPAATEEEVLELALDPAADAFDSVVGQDLLAALQATLAKLPWRQRAVWVLREVEELGYDEIAQALGLTTDAVRGQLHRARRTVADQMEGWRND